MLENYERVRHVDVLDQHEDLGAYSQPETYRNLLLWSWAEQFGHTNQELLQQIDSDDTKPRHANGDCVPLFFELEVRQQENKSQYRKTYLRTD